MEFSLPEMLIEIVRLRPNACFATGYQEHPTSSQVARQFHHALTQEIEYRNRREGMKRLTLGAVQKGIRRQTRNRHW